MLFEIVDQRRLGEHRGEQLFERDSPAGVEQRTGVDDRSRRSSGGVGVTVELFADFADLENERRNGGDRMKELLLVWLVGEEVVERLAQLNELSLSTPMS